MMDYDDDTYDPILASMHGRSSVGGLHAIHHTAFAGSGGGRGGGGGGGGGGWGQAAMRGVHGFMGGPPGGQGYDGQQQWAPGQNNRRFSSTVDPFAQLNATMATSAGGGLASAAGDFWEQWKYTIYVFLPGALMMLIYFKFSYAEEIN